MAQSFGNYGTGPTVITRSAEAVREFVAEKRRKISKKFSRLSKVGFLDKIKLETYDNDEKCKWRITIVNQPDQARISLIQNKLRCEMTDLNYIKEWTKMDKDLNKLYGEMKKYHVTDGIPSSSSICPGMLVAVCDRSSDQIGRFRRAQIIQVSQSSTNSNKLSSPASLTTVTCKLIDDAYKNLQIFRGEEIYLLVTKFLEIPPRFFSIQLSGIGAFIGSPKLGRVIETMLSIYGYDYSMQIKKKIEPGLLEVVLFAQTLPASLSANDFILSELFKIDVGSQNWFFSFHPVKGTVFNSVIFLYCTKDSVGIGKVGLCLKSRELDAIEDHLQEAEDNFSAYLLVNENEQEKFKIGDSCLAKHPQKNRVRRCKILTINEMTNTPRLLKCTVSWMDDGGQCNLLCSELIPARFVSQLLHDAEPRCTEFKLANVNQSTSTSKLSVLPEGSEVGMRIVDTGSTVHDIGTDRVTVELFNYKTTSRGEEFQSLNRQLLQMASVKTSKSKSLLEEFVPKKYVQPSGLMHIQMNYLTREWTLDSGSSLQSPRRDHLKLKEGDEITFFVSQIFSSTDFTIHPWLTKDSVPLLRSMIQEYCENQEWVKAERDEGLEHLPWGSFLAYFKNGVYHRIKFICNIVNENSTEKRDLVKVLLLERGRYDRAEFKHLVKIGQPFRFFTDLSPQGAVGRWKYALDLHSKLKNNKKSCSKTGLQNNSSMLETTLRRELENRTLKEKNPITARVEAITIDENGRADFHLSFPGFDESAFMKNLNLSN